jgi:uncharacterized membrane protein
MTPKFIHKGWFVFVILILFLTDLAVLLNVPFLRQILGFFFLTILPGLLILQILKLNKLNTIETILYSVGVSVAFLMFIGFFMNTLYPPLGIPNPISTSHLMLTISIIIIILSIISYQRNKNFSISIPTNLKESFSPSVLFLVLLPILGVLGAYLVTFYGNNTILLLLIILIALAVVLAMFDIIPTKLFPLAIVMIALALLFHHTFISFHLCGGGDHGWEYYFHLLVVKNSLWDPTIKNNLNAMLSVVMLPTIYSKLLNMDGMWVKKIIYPLIFTMVPLALYQIYRRQINDKTAFLSVFYFMSFSLFYYIMRVIPRQAIAELFFALFILLIVDKDMNKKTKAPLMIIFVAALAVSHYGLSYFFMGYLIVAWLLLFLLENINVSSLKQRVHSKFNFNASWLKINQNSVNANSQNKNTALPVIKTLSVTFIAIYLVFALSWYMYVSSSSVFTGIVSIGDHIYSSIFIDFFNPLSRESSVLLALGMGTVRPFFWVRVNAIVQHTIQIFIIVGAIRLMAKHRELKFTREFVAMVFVSTVILLACIVLPFFSEKMAIGRIYHITLFLLAPCCILGGETVWKYVSKAFRSISFKRSTYAKICLIILIPYFLFNIGFVHEFTEHPTGSPVSFYRLAESNDPIEKKTYYLHRMPTQDFVSATWLSERKNDQSAIYTGWLSKEHLLRPYPLPPTERIYILDPPNMSIKKSDFVFLRCLNVKDNIMMLPSINIGSHIFQYPYYNTTEITGLSVKNKIYSNGGSEIYR